MLSITSLGCLLRSSGRLKGWNADSTVDGTRNHRRNQGPKGHGQHGTRKGARGPPTTTTTAGTSGGFHESADPRAGKVEVKRKSKRKTHPSTSKTRLTSREEREESDNTSSSSSFPSPSPSKTWDARRRDPKINGADLYVARITKTKNQNQNRPRGSAHPCWRCVEWARWAGIKRIFHWNADLGKFDVVKVNNVQCSEKYETNADYRMFAGLA